MFHSQYWVQILATCDSFTFRGPWGFELDFLRLPCRNKSASTHGWGGRDGRVGGSDSTYHAWVDLRHRIWIKKGWMRWKVKQWEVLTRRPRHGCQGDLLNWDRNNNHPISDMWCQLAAIQSDLHCTIHYSVECYMERSMLDYLKHCGLSRKEY